MNEEWEGAGDLTIKGETREGGEKRDSRKEDKQGRVRDLTSEKKEENREWLKILQVKEVK